MRPAVKWEEIVGRCGDNLQTSFQVIGMFQTQLPEQFRELKQSINEGDVSQACAKSHRLKGVAATLSAEPIAELASVIDVDLRAGRTERVEQNVADLELEIDRCLDWIEAKLKETNE